MRVPAFCLVSMLLAAAVAADEPKALVQFRAARVQHATDLVQPIAACVQRNDTSHPVFRGCIDWHSSVHGVWALSAYGRLTGRDTYAQLVQSTLDSARLADERSYLSQNAAFEMPYGRAWFLRLAIDYERAFADDRLKAFADEVARSLTDYYARRAPDPASIAYDSASWALINLHEYGVWRGDKAITSFVEGKVRASFLRRSPCPLDEVEVGTREFMAVCTNWAWLVGKVLPPQEFKVWLAAFLPADVEIEPIGDEASVHQAGLNFSRAWGLWHLYKMTGEERFLEAFLRHFKATFDRPDIWRGNYRSHAHWVAQFGMLALAVSADADVSRGP